MQWQDSVGTQTLRDALDTRAGPALDTRTVRGEGDPSPAPWTVPVRGKSLQGDALLAQVRDWQQRGIIEPGAAESLARCVAHPQWFDLSDRTLVLLGAASEAGPLRWLMRWRATVVAVDIPHAGTWQRLQTEARQGNGVLMAPAHQAADASSAAVADPIPGVDLLRDAPAVAAWLQTLPGPLDVAALAYLDGERHVRVVLAMDMVMQALCAADARTGLAFLATPTDVFAVPRAVEDAALAAFARRPLASRALQGLLALATGTRFFQPNTIGGPRPAWWRRKRPGRVGRDRQPGAAARPQLRAGQTHPAVARAGGPGCGAPRLAERRPFHHHQLGGEESGAGGRVCRGRQFRRRGVRTRHHQRADGGPVGP